MSVHGLWTFYFFAVGACVGSFVNVIIYRVPKKLSIIRPGSRCPSCGSPIGWRHNIPVLSYIALKGRCARCGAEISARYPLVELITAFLFALCFIRFGLTPSSAVYMFFSSALVAVAFIDLDEMIIPDVITLPGIVAGLLCSWLVLPISVTDALLGMLAGGGVFFLIALAVPHGMGGGDIKLMGMVGSFLGLKSVLITIFLGSLFGSIGGLVGIVLFGKGRKTQIPFGPYLALGALIAMFFENELVGFYLSAFAGR